MIKINFRKNEIVREDVFKNDNFTRSVEFDFTDCGVDGWKKYLDIKTSDGENFRVDLGSETIIEYELTNMITRKGELHLNPVAVKEREDGSIAQKGFKTYVINVQDTINSYGLGNPEYDDVIIPIKHRLDDLEELTEAHSQNLEELNSYSKKHKLEFIALKTNVEKLDKRESDNNSAMDKRVINLANDVQLKYKELNQTAYDNYKELKEESIELSDRLDATRTQFNTELQKLGFDLGNKITFEVENINKDIDIKVGALDEKLISNVKELNKTIETNKTYASAALANEASTRAEMDRGLQDQINSMKESIPKDFAENIKAIWAEMSNIENRYIALNDKTVKMITNLGTDVNELVKRVEVLELGGGGGGEVDPEIAKAVVELQAKSKEMSVDILGLQRWVAQIGDVQERYTKKHDELSEKVNQDAVVISELQIETNKQSGIIEENGKTIGLLEENFENLKEDMNYAQGDIFVMKDKIGDNESNIATNKESINSLKVTDINTIGRIIKLEKSDTSQNTDIDELKTVTVEILGALAVYKDFIIDKGYNSNGYWEKWNSGKLVMYGVSNQNVATSDKVGAIYYGACQKIMFPVKNLNDKYVINYTSDTATGLNWIGTNNNGCEVDGVTPRIFGAINLERDYQIRWHVIGRWK